MKTKFIRIAEIIEYVFTFLYFFTCALFYSMSNKLYWLFLALGLLSLCLGLYAESIHNRLEKNPPHITQQMNLRNTALQ